MSGIIVVLQMKDTRIDFDELEDGCRLVPRARFASPVGMGADFRGRLMPSPAMIFEQADDILGFGLSRICFERSERPRVGSDSHNAASPLCLQHSHLARAARTASDGPAFLDGRATAWANTRL